LLNVWIFTANFIPKFIGRGKLWKNE